MGATSLSRPRRPSRCPAEHLRRRGRRPLPGEHRETCASGADEPLAEFGGREQPGETVLDPSQVVGLDRASPRRRPPPAARPPSRSAPGHRPRTPRAPGTRTPQGRVREGRRAGQQTSFLLIGHVAGEHDATPNVVREVIDLRAKGLDALRHRTRPPAITSHGSASRSARTPRRARGGSCEARSRRRTARTASDPEALPNAFDLVGRRPFEPVAPCASRTRGSRRSGGVRAGRSSRSPTAR